MLVARASGHNRSTRARYKMSGGRFLKRVTPRDDELLVSEHVLLRLECTVQADVVSAWADM